MDFPHSMATLVLLLLLASYVKAHVGLFYIRKYGAIPNGDITMMHVYQRLHAKLWFLALQKIHSTLMDKTNGTFHGGGKMAWKQNIYATNNNCKKLAMINIIKITNFFHVNVFGCKNIAFTNFKVSSLAYSPNTAHSPQNFGFGFVNNSVIQDITSKDSKYFHNITFTNFEVNSLAYSPNTNGSHIGKSTQVKITKIDTDNDYISLGDGSKEVIILNVTCGLEHKFVEDLNVKNCTLRNTNNGLRIKTWPGTPINSLAFDLHFEDTKMINIKSSANGTKSIKNKDKQNHFQKYYKNFYHSRRSTLVCRSDVPFEIVDLNDIDIRFNGTTLATEKYANVKSNFGRKAPICAT
ncbi:Polygalacturonase [Glycine soja]